MKRYLVLALAALALAGCDAMTAHTDVVARAGEIELSVDEAVDLLTANESVPGRPEVVRSVADLWIDYALLASEAGEDSTFSEFDVEPLLRPYIEQQTFAELRSQVLTGDTVFTDDELRQLYATQGPGARLKARHILLTVPEGAVGTAQDSVRALAEELRQRAASGEDFSALAREYSTDEGTAQQGGDLGWFERGDMVEPFEVAAFDLGVGEVSSVVETPFGLHIIKLDDREVPAFEDSGEDFRRQLINERKQASLDEYVETVRAAQEMEVEEGAPNVARDVAENPSTPLRGRAASRELVTWEGGELTAGELVRLFTGMPMTQRARYTSLGDDQMTQLLRDVATNELIMEDAADRGITVPAAEQDSVREMMRGQVIEIARDAGFIGPPQEGENQREAQERRVRAFFEGVLSGEQNVMPLGALSYTLRQQKNWRLFETGVNEAANRLEQRRADTTTDAGDGQVPTPPPGAARKAPAPDTGG